MVHSLGQQRAVIEMTCLYMLGLHRTEISFSNSTQHISHRRLDIIDFKSFSMSTVPASSVISIFKQVMQAHQPQSGHNVKTERMDLLYKFIFMMISMVGHRAYDDIFC